MVPADDEHTSANEAENNASTQKNFFEKLKFWKRRKIDGEPAPLQPLPDCLMKWKAPVVIAGAGFVIALFFAIIWHGTPHWPSAEAMKLCATIAGAGFAFSAWQQRSHDNAANAKQAQATAEREDYWKRREHIYQLLGSENPGLRLSAVALLAELADQEARSTRLNKTEKYQLQQHIIDTLCLQLRHEGRSPGTTEDLNEHEKIQQIIINTIFERANINIIKQSFADWSRHNIDLSNSNILPPIHIFDFHTHSIINLDGSHFFQPVTIKNAKICRLVWATSTFHSHLSVGSFENPTELGTDRLPHKVQIAEFYNTNLISKNSLTIFRTPSTNNATRGEISFRSCNFIIRECTCPSSCSCKINANLCICHIQSECNCTEQCFINGEIDIMDMSDEPNRTNKHPDLRITRCTTGRVYIEFDNSSANIYLSNNSIEEEIYISLDAHSAKTDCSHDIDEVPPVSKHHISLSNNTTLDGHTPSAIHIKPNNKALVSDYVHINLEQ